MASKPKAQETKRNQDSRKGHNINTNKGNNRRFEVKNDMFHDTLKSQINGNGNQKHEHAIHGVTIQYGANMNIYHKNNGLYDHLIKSSDEHNEYNQLDQHACEPAQKSAYINS